MLGQQAQLHYSTKSKQEVTQTPKNRVRTGLKGHKNMLELSSKEGEMYAHLVGQQDMQARQEERGPPPPIFGHKINFPPLKFL